MEYPDPETFEFTPNISTISRLAKIHDCDVETEETADKEKTAQNRTENVKESLLKLLTETTEAIKKQDHDIFIESPDLDPAQIKLYAEIREIAEGKIPISSSSELDFTSKENLENSSYVSLATMLGIESNDESGGIKNTDTIKEEIQQKLQDAGIEKEKAIAFMENLRSFIQIRMELNLLNATKLDDLDEEALSGHLKGLNERKKWLRDLIKMGVHPDPYNQELSSDPAERDKQLERR